MIQSGNSFDTLRRPHRLALLRFVCSFAWADFEIQPEERRLIQALVRRLEFASEDAERVEDWLIRPPAPESVDPELVPREHRELFLAFVEAVVMADGHLAEEERDSLTLLRQLLA